jgi:hypothetical protein
VRAHVTASLRPTRSHVVVLAISIIGGISLFSGLAFLSAEKFLAAAVALLIGLGLVGAAISMWSASRRDVDMVDAPPTTISDELGRVVFQTDSRSLDNADLLRAVTEMLANIAYRRPLPSPQGLVGDDGKPVPNSQAAAKEEVRKANEQAAHQYDGVMGRLEGGKVFQSVHESLPVPSANAISHDRIQPVDREI